ncbi:hypothetical protein GO755_10700 [Spirosoma sp. HMF4905]|uniref:Uncharacterized protein n=1 Tax=Spirosoma arboris TaxID=2682092 RepID=A0A7K1S9I3_9BACT|nr:hypothetical protein [Spirosoma arboris]MVM30503.1 hypothetical protein [Spirosoma arboris]
MDKRKQKMPSINDGLTQKVAEASDVFALDNVTQLREAIDQAVYGQTEENKLSESDRAHTVEGLTTLGQMGMLTETDLDEARKGYL